MSIKFEHQPESRKHIYGNSSRWPGEKLFVEHVNAIHRAYPEFTLRLIGTSGVHGEKFPLFQTRCEFTVPNQESIDLCVKALKESDELIRRRIEPHWEWNAMWVNGLQVMFFVNWHDFAYFMKHKEIFLKKDHSRFALDFGLEVESIDFEHFKIFKDGSLSTFAINKISKREQEILENLDQITFNRDFKEKRF